MPTPRQSQVHIDTAQIPDHVRYELLSVVYDATVTYFQQPGVAEKFERWKAAKEAAQAAKQNQQKGVIHK